MARVPVGLLDRGLGRLLRILMVGYNVGGDFEFLLKIHRIDPRISFDFSVFATAIEFIADPVKVFKYFFFQKKQLINKIPKILFRIMQIWRFRVNK